MRHLHWLNHLNPTITRIAIRASVGMVFTPVQSTLAVQGLCGIVAPGAVDRNEGCVFFLFCDQDAILVGSAESALLIHSGFVAAFVKASGHFFILATICRVFFKLFFCKVIELLDGFPDVGSYNLFSSFEKKTN
jgi:hypothetical protein